MTATIVCLAVAAYLAAAVFSVTQLYRFNAAVPRRWQVLSDDLLCCSLLWPLMLVVWARFAAESALWKIARV